MPWTSPRRPALSSLAGRRFDVVIHCASSGRGDAEQVRSGFLCRNPKPDGKFKYGRLIFTSSTSVYAQTDGS